MFKQIISKRKFCTQKHENDKIYRDPSPLPIFSMIDEKYAGRAAKLSISMHVRSPWRWTPFIQKENQSEEFMKKMNYFQKLKQLSYRKIRIFEEHHRGELIDAFLFEALKTTNFDYYYDYKCKSTAVCPFHGIVDFLIYNKQNDSMLPLIPVIKIMLDKIQIRSQILKDQALNMGPPIAVAFWTLQNIFALSQDYRKSTVILTDGNNWKLIRLGIDGTFDKTSFYCPNNEFGKIYYDYDLQQIVLGLIKQSLNEPTEKEKVLKSIYDFVDERRYLTPISENEKEHLRRQSRFWRFLPKQIREFFFPNI